MFPSLGSKGEDVREEENGVETEDEEDESEMLMATRFEVDKLKIVFQKADSDRDGQLTKSDVRELLEGRSGRREDIERFRRWCRKVGVDVESGDVDHIFSFLDKQNNGLVDWNNFASALEADIRLDLVRQQTLRLPLRNEGEVRIRGGFTHVLVVVRVRPLSKKEKKAHAERRNKQDNMPATCVQVSAHGNGHHLVGITKPAKAGAVLKSQAKPKRNFFAFDKVFGPSSTTSQIYQTVILPNRLVERYLDGISVTVFAYGATGSGKSFTMMGSKYCSPSSSAVASQPGIVQQLLTDVFSMSQSRERGVSMEFSVSYLEIYNETLQDLLVDDSRGDDRTKKKKKLILCEDPKSHVVDVLGLTKKRVTCTSDVMKLVNYGNKRRIMASTAANEFSSRSHAVLQLSYRRREKLARGGKREKSSMLTMVDLAGSERAAQTLNRGKRLREGANINRSLLALGSCIKALAQRGSRGQRSSKVRPKFRDSKLTLMLKNSLEGRSVLVMLAMASPSMVQYNDTINTFKYADRAKSISVTPEQQSMITWPKNEARPSAKHSRAKGAVKRIKVRTSKDGSRELRRTHSAPKDRKETPLDGCVPLASRAVNEAPPVSRPHRSGVVQSTSGRNKSVSALDTKNGGHVSRLKLLKAKRLSKLNSNHARSPRDVSCADSPVPQPRKTNAGKKKGNHKSNGNVRKSQEQSALDIVLQTAMDTPLPKTYCNGDKPTRWVVTADCGAPLSCAGGPMSTYMIPKGDTVDAVGEHGGWLEIRAFVPKRLLRRARQAIHREETSESVASTVASTVSSTDSTKNMDSPPRVAIKRIRSVDEGKPTTESSTTRESHLKRDECVVEDTNGDDVEEKSTATSLDATDEDETELTSTTVL